MSVDAFVLLILSSSIVILPTQDRLGLHDHLRQHRAHVRHRLPAPHRRMEKAHGKQKEPLLELNFRFLVIFYTLGSPLSCDI